MSSLNPPFLCSLIIYYDIHKLVCPSSERSCKYPFSTSSPLFTPQRAERSREPRRHLWLCVFSAFNNRDSFYQKKSIGKCQKLVEFNLAFHNTWCQHMLTSGSHSSSLSPLSSLLAPLSFSLFPPLSFSAPPIKAEQVFAGRLRKQRGLTAELYAV